MTVYEIKSKKEFELSFNKSVGEEAMLCPVCSHTRKKKGDKCMSWNHSKNIGRCNHCDAHFVESRPLDMLPKKEYVRPVWKNITGLTEKAVKWFEGRGISQPTLNKLRIYSDIHPMMIRLSNGDKVFRKDAEVIAFPYFMPDEDSPRNIQYRGANKSFALESGAELIFYNIDKCLGVDEVIITEGQIDCASYIEAGYDNVMSVPNGASSRDMTYLDNYIHLFDSVKRFYIATDYDQVGIELRNELIRRLGAERCFVVSYEGFKDANELLVHKGKQSVSDSITNAVECPISGEVNFDAHLDSLMSLYQYGIQKGKEIDFAPIDSLVNWDTGRLAIWTGIPASGKSNVVDFVAIKLNVCHGWKTLYFSPEYHPISLHIAEMAEKITGKKFSSQSMNKMEYDEVIDNIRNNYFFINPEEVSDVDTILDVAKQFVKKRGIKHLVIDPFNTLEFNKPAGKSDTQHIGEILNKLVTFARKYDILISLVAHPRKIQENINGTGYKIPTMYDISGSSTFYDKADYGIVIYRDFNTGITRFILQKVKFRQNGRVTKTAEEGSMTYDVYNGRYNTVGYKDTSNWLRKDVGNSDISFDVSEWDDLPM